MSESIACFRSAGVAGRSLIEAFGSIGIVAVVFHADALLKRESTRRPFGINVRNSHLFKPDTLFTSSQNGQ